MRPAPKPPLSPRAGQTAAVALGKAIPGRAETITAVTRTHTDPRSKGTSPRGCQQMPIRGPWPCWASSAPNTATGKGDGGHLFAGVAVAAVPVSPATLPSSGGSAVAHGPDSCALGGPGRAAQTLRSLRRAAHAALVRLSRAERARCMEPKPTQGLVPEAPLLELLGARTLHGANCHVQVCRKCLTLAAVISQCDRWRRSHRRALPTSAPPESVLQAPGAASCL